MAVKNSPHWLRPWFRDSNGEYQAAFNALVPDRYKEKPMKKKGGKKKVADAVFTV